MKEERTSDGAFSDTTFPARDGDDFLYIWYWPLRERCGFARNLRGSLLALARESKGILMTGTKRGAEETRESFPTWKWSQPVHQSATTFSPKMFNYVFTFDNNVLLITVPTTTYVIAGRDISINVDDGKATASTHCTWALRHLLVLSMLYPG